MYLAMARALILATGIWTIAQHFHMNSDDGVILGALMILFIERSLSIVQDAIQKKDTFVAIFGRKI